MEQNSVETESEQIATRWLDCGGGITLEVAFGTVGKFFIFSPFRFFASTEIVSEAERRSISSSLSVIVFPAQGIEDGLYYDIFVPTE